MRRGQRPRVARAIRCARTRPARERGLPARVRSDSLPLLMSTSRQSPEADADTLENEPGAVTATQGSENRAARARDRALEALNQNTIAGRYEIKSMVGKGGFGTVFLAHDALSGRDVAVKFLAQRSASERAAFRREIGLLRLLRLPGVVRFIDDGFHGDQPFLVTELVDGTPFPGPCGMGWDTMKETVVAFFEALERLHTHGVLHLDLKPSNVLVDAHGRPVILDFGVAVPPTLRPDETSAPMVGTPIYMSPQQLRGRPSCVASDLYSAGVMLFEALAGGVAFVGRNSRDLLEAKSNPPRLQDRNPEVPSHVCDVVASLLAPTIEGRPESAGEVAELLSTRRTTPSFLASLHQESGVISRAELKRLFHGPEVAFHLQTDAAEALSSRTQGAAAAVAEELESWVRAGLCFWDHGRIRIDREAVERLQAGLVVRRRPAGVRVDSDDQFAPTLDHPVVANRPRRASISSSLIQTPRGRLGPAPTKTHTSPSSRARQLEVGAAVVEVARARRDGRLSAATALLDGLIALARASGWQNGEELVLVETVKLAIQRQSVEAIDVAIYELGRMSVETPRLVALERLLRAARIVRVGDSASRSASVAESVPPFDDPELERLRRAQIILAAHHAPIHVHEAVANDTLQWARTTHNRALIANVTGWTGFLEYRKGDYPACARLNSYAAANSDTLLARVSALSNATMAQIEAGELEGALESALEGQQLTAPKRLTFFEFRFRRMQREAEYRLSRAGELDDGLIEAASLVEVKSEVAPALLNQAATAWRIRDFESARVLGRQSAEAFGSAAVPAGVVLALGLTAAAGASFSDACVEGLLKDAGANPVGVIRQAVALFEFAGCTVKDDFRPESPPAEVSEIRAEVLSTAELLDPCKIMDSVGDAR